MSPHDRLKNAARSILPSALLAGTGLLLFPVSGQDDKYITYWSAHALSNIGDLVNYNGQRVEQSSSLAHVALLAALAWLRPLPMPVWGWIVSVFFGVGTIFLTQRLAARVNPALGLPAGFIAASSVGLMYWSFGGLETTLVSFLSLTLSFIGLRCLRMGFTWINTALSAVITFLFVAARPESVFVAAAAWVGIATITVIRTFVWPTVNSDTDTNDWTLIRRTIALIVLAVVSFGLLATFRYAYFDDVFPQPVRAKVGWAGLTPIYNGVRYIVLGGARRGDLLLWLPCFVASPLLVLRSTRTATVDVLPMLVSTFLGAQVAFTVFTGGDWMEMARFLVPGVPFAAIVTAWLFIDALALWGRSLLVAFVIMQLLICVSSARRSSTSSPLWSGTYSSAPGADRLPLTWFDTQNRMHTHLMPSTAKVLDVVAAIRGRKSTPVTIMSGQMGFVPFYVAKEFFGHVQFVDMGGLVTRHVTELPAASGLRRSNSGIRFSYAQLFAIADRSASPPDWVLPDIIVDYEKKSGVDSRRERQAEAHDYVVVFRQRGFPSSRSSILPGKVREDDLFIAVRREVLPPGGIDLTDVSLH